MTDEAKITDAEAQIAGEAVVNARKQSALRTEQAGIVAEMESLFSRPITTQNTQRRAAIKQRLGELDTLLGEGE